MIFNPSKLDESYVFRQGNEVEIKVEDNVSINCLYLKNQDSKGVILYLHGNRGNNRRCLRQASMFEDLGYDIFMPDYRGYGKSDGRLTTESQLFTDMRAVYEYLLEIYKPEDIQVLGYSLGTGIATYLASEYSPTNLFLVSPYLSFIDLKNRMFPLIPNFLIKFPMRNNKMIQDVRSQVFIFHGTDDEIIPYDSSIKLRNLKKDSKLITLNNTGHRGTIFHNSVRNEVMKALN